MVVLRELALEVTRAAGTMKSAGSEETTVSSQKRHSDTTGMLRSGILVLVSDKV